MFAYALLLAGGSTARVHLATDTYHAMDAKGRRRAMRTLYQRMYTTIATKEGVVVYQLLHVTATSIETCQQYLEEMEWQFGDAILGVLMNVVDASGAKSHTVCAFPCRTRRVTEWVMCNTWKRRNGTCLPMADELQKLKLKGYVGVGILTFLLRCQG